MTYKKIINSEYILLKDFFEKIDYAYSASDIIISRAGAMALNEISFLGKPMILIPLPSSAGNHQFYNALSFNDKNAAIMIEEKNIQDGIVEKTIIELINNQNKMKKIAQNASEMIKKDAREHMFTKRNTICSKNCC